MDIFYIKRVFSSGCFKNMVEISWNESKLKKKKIVSKQIYDMKTLVSFCPFQSVYFKLVF